MPTPVLFDTTVLSIMGMKGPGALFLEAIKSSLGDTKQVPLCLFRRENGILFIMIESKYIRAKIEST